MAQKNFRLLFWDVADDFDPCGYPRYTIERVLEYGDEDAVRWMRSIFTQDQILEVLRTGRNLTPLSANFWAVLLGVPANDIRRASRHPLTVRAVFCHHRRRRFTCATNRRFGIAKFCPPRGRGRRVSSPAGRCSTASISPAAPAWRSTLATAAPSISTSLASTALIPSIFSTGSAVWTTS